MRGNNGSNPCRGFSPGRRAEKRKKAESEFSFAVRFYEFSELLLILGRGSRHHHDGHRLIELEIQLRFRGNFHFLPVSHALVNSPARASDSRANRGAFTAAGNGSDNRAQHGPAAHFFGGIFAA